MQWKFHSFFSFFSVLFLSLKLFCVFTLFLLYCVLIFFAEKPNQRWTLDCEYSPFAAYHGELICDFCWCCCWGTYLRLTGNLSILLRGVGRRGRSEGDGEVEEGDGEVLTTVSEFRRGRGRGRREGREIGVSISQNSKQIGVTSFIHENKVFSLLISHSCSSPSSGSSCSLLVLIFSISSLRFAIELLSF